MPYPNDLPQEVERRVTKCIRWNLQFVNTLSDSISYADADWLVPKCSCDFKATSSIISRCLYICDRSFLALRRFRTWRRATMTEDSMCELAMIYVHRNDTVGQVIPEAVLKRRDSSGNRKIHLAFTDLVLSFEIIQ